MSKIYLPIKPGTIISNQELCEIFLCSPQGGMRRSRKTNSLVIITSMIGSTYQDVWNDDILLYTGMGQKGDQKLDKYQNKTLNEIQANKVSVHYFEKYESNNYYYIGEMEKADNPYQSYQCDNEGNNRKVWIFPLKTASGSIPYSVSEKSMEYEKYQEEMLSKKDTIDIYKQVKHLNKISKRSHISTQYMRNPEISLLVKRLANGYCDLCKESAPFIDKEGTPFLECHHIEWLAHGGEDSLENTIALCPNCHRKMHIIPNNSDILRLKNIALERVQKLQLLYPQQNIKK